MNLTGLQRWIFCIFLFLFMLFFDILPGPSLHFSRQPWRMSMDVFGLCVQGALLIGLLVNHATQKKTEERRRLSEERFRKIAENLPVAVSCADKDLNIIFNNDKFNELFGYSREEIPTVYAWFEKTYTDETQRRSAIKSWRAYMDDCARKTAGKPYVVVESITCRDGTTKQIEITDFMDDEYAYAVFNDITERKAMEEALQRSREKLALAAGLAGLAPWKFNMEKGLFEFGNEFYAVYGTDVAREGPFMAPDVYIREFVHPDDAGLVKAEMDKLFAAPDRYYFAQVEHRIIRRDGAVRTIVVRVNVNRDAGGKIIKWYGANQDITECKALEEDIRIARDTLSLAAELARLGPWKYHSEKELFEFGDEFYAIYGTNVAREGAFMAPQIYVKEFVHPEDAWIAAAEIERALASRERRYSAQLEHRIIRRDGAVRTIVVRINIIRDGAGKILKWYGANQDITEYKRVEAALCEKSAEMERAAYTDALTGLPNRAYLGKRLAQEMERAGRGEAAGVVLFIDLDDLKMVNDAYGHTYGDALIVLAGKRIVEHVGINACVGRFGGDEFLVILAGESDRHSICQLADGIIKALNQEIEVLGIRFHISASVGAAIYPDDGYTAEEIFKNADNAVYAAKNAGKNCCRFFEAAMQKEAYEKMMLTNSLHGVVNRGELLLHYQPQVIVESGAIVGFEALLRWHSREYGDISPARFIPLAEQSGNIHGIGQWVLREACMFARRLADHGRGDIRIAVNMSPYQLAADNFVDIVCKAVSSACIEPRQLELEITENVLIISLEDSVGKLSELRDMGVRLSLDDFGKGYSSLTYLQRLPVKTLKIDKSFIDMIPSDESHKAIISTIVDMAHILQMTVVAEGVETKAQVDYLVQKGCDCVQGFLYSRPLPEEEALRLLCGPA